MHKISLDINCKNNKSTDWSVILIWFFADRDFPHFYTSKVRAEASDLGLRHFGILLPII